jgi:hypothetical protein
MAYGGKWWLPILTGKYKRSVTLPKVKEKVKPGRASGSSTPQDPSPHTHTLSGVWGICRITSTCSWWWAIVKLKKELCQGGPEGKKVMPGWTKRPYGQSWGNCPRGPKLKNGGTAPLFWIFGQKGPIWTTSSSSNLPHHNFLGLLRFFTLTNYPTSCRKPRTEQKGPITIITNHLSQTQHLE